MTDRWAVVRALPWWLTRQTASTPGRRTIATDAVTHLLSLDDDPELLRASGRNQILARGGRIFASSEGCANTYALSDQVERIDVFISHNWCVSRKWKSLALTFYFYIVHALLVTMLFCVLLGTLYSLDMLPVYSMQSLGKHYGVMCRLFCFPVWLVTLVVFKDVELALGRKGPRMFLDKTCIHQTDSDLKRKGISKLGAFLVRSDRMLILYSDIYMQKLWTIFELAVFLMVRDAEDIRVVPVRMPLAIISSFGFVYVSQYLTIFCLPHARATPLVEFCVIQSVNMLFCGWIFKWNRDAERMVQSIRNFSFSKCTCFCAEDRPIVETTIAHLIFSAGLIKEGTDETALEAFDKCVRNIFPKALRSSTRRHSSAAKQTVSLSLLFLIPEYVDVHLTDNALVWHRKLALFLMYITRSLIVLPVSVYAFEKLSASRRFQSCWAEMLWFLLSFHVTTVPPALVAFGYTQLMIDPRFEGYHIVLIVAHVIGYCLAALLFDVRWQMMKKKSEGLIDPNTSSDTNVIQEKE
eukprot:TRINITY_DN28252_c0_g1_i1.p1 TRINITY_DN28252_c0_g1~~TRINITY_DN28252_c0_g1_i1.p1  ORF type:complete len:523 (+),score=38.30 TRINITY_DN28252_c0_g1_i1:166-1734(+)